MSKLIKKWFSRTQTYVLLIIILYLIFLGIKAPHFYNPANLVEVVRSSSWMWIFGMAVMVCLISGGFDVSYTCIAVCSAYITGMIMVKTGIDNLLLAFFLSMLIGAAYGAINGLVIHIYKLPSFIATLGTKTVFIGIMALTVGVSSLEPDECPPCLKDFGMAKLFSATAENGTTYGLSVMIIPMIIIVAITWFIMYRTRTGRGIVAMGNSQEAAKRAGYNTFYLHMFVYMFIGVLSGIAGLLSFAEVSWIAPLSSTLNNGMQLTIIAAVIIGGTNISGGEGTIFGTMLGILLVRLFDTTLIFIGISSSWNDFFVGIVLVVCLSVTSLQRFYSRRRRLLFDE